MVAARLQPGQLVRVRGGRGKLVWRVVREDTTARDPEPAYRLARMGRPGTHDHARYAYQSDLEALTPEEIEEFQRAAR